MCLLTGAEFAATLHPELRIADYNSRKLTALQRPPYAPVYEDELSGEDG